MPETYQEKMAAIKAKRTSRRQSTPPKRTWGDTALSAAKGVGDVALGLGQMLVRGPAGMAHDMANEVTGDFITESGLSGSPWQGFKNTMSKAPIVTAEGVTGVPFREIGRSWDSPEGPTRAIAQGVAGLGLNAPGARAGVRGARPRAGAPPPAAPPGAPPVVRPRRPPVRTMPVASNAGAIPDLPPSPPSFLRPGFKEPTIQPPTPPPPSLGPVAPIETPPSFLRPTPEAAPPKKAASPVKPKKAKPEEVARPFKLATDKDLTALANRGNQTALDEIAFRTKPPETEAPGRLKKMLGDETGAVGKDISDIQKRNKLRKLYPDAESALPEIAFQKYGKKVDDLTSDEYWSAYDDAMDSAQDLTPEKGIIDLNAKPGQKLLGPVEEPVSDWQQRQKDPTSYEGRNFNADRTPLTSAQRQIRASSEKIQKVKDEYTSWVSKQQESLPEGETFTPSPKKQRAHEQAVKIFQDEHNALVERLDPPKLGPVERDAAPPSKQLGDVGELLGPETNPWSNDAHRMRMETANRPRDIAREDSNAQWNRSQRNAALQEGRNINDIHTPPTRVQEQIRASYEKMNETNSEYSRWFSEQEEMLPEGELFKPPPEIEAAHKAQYEQMQNDHRVLVERLTGGYEKAPLPDIEVPKLGDVEPPKTIKAKDWGDWGGEEKGLPDLINDVDGSTVAAPRHPTAERWEGIVKELEAEGAPDSAYRDILSTSTKNKLKRGETWKSRVLDGIKYYDSRIRKSLGDEKGAVSVRLATGKWKRKPENPHMKPYRGWVNYRNAAMEEGHLKGKGFRDLDTAGPSTLNDFRKGDRTGRLKDVQRYLDTVSFDMSQEGVKPGFKKNYLFQIFDSPKQEILDVARRLKLRPEFSAQSVLDNMEIGEGVGLKPKFQNMGDFVGWYEKTARLAIADRMFFNNLKSQNLIKGSRKAPADWKSVDPDLFPIRSREGFKAPPEVAKTINNYLRDPAEQGSVWAASADVAGITKNMILSSGGPGTALNAHGVNITVRSLLNRGPLKAIGTLAKLVNTGAEGKIPQTIEKLAPWQSAKAHYESIRATAPRAMKHGLTLTSEEHKMNSVGSTHMGESLGRTLTNMPGKRGVVARTAFKPLEKGLDWVLQKHGKYFEDPLFRNVVPDEKLSLFNDLYKDFLKKGLSTEEAGRSAAEFTNDAYGGINWEAMGNSRDGQNALRSLILAPDWFRTNLRTMKGMGKAAANPKAGESRQYAYMVRNLLGAYVAAEVANKLSSGHHIWENDPGHKLQIQMGKSGTKNRYINPFGTAVDFFRLPLETAASAAQGDLSQGPKILKNRLSTLVQPTINILKNEDDFGRPLAGKDAYGRQIGLGKQMGNYLGEVGGMVLPSYLANPMELATGKHENVEQALLGSVEAPVRYAKPSQKGVRKQRARSRTR